MTAGSAGPTPETLLQWLREGDDTLRVRALDAIGDLRPEGAFEVVVEHLHHPKPRVRMAAACNLADIGDARAIPYLLEVVRDDPDKDVRDEAVRSLDTWRDDSILQGLVREVSRPDRSWVVLRAVARQLRHYDRSEAVAALLELLSDEELLVRDVAAESLLQLNRPSLRRFWEEAMGDPSDEVRRIADEALIELDSRTARSIPYPGPGDARNR